MEKGYNYTRQVRWLTCFDKDRFDIDVYRKEVVGAEVIFKAAYKLAHVFLQHPHDAVDLGKEKLGQYVLPIHIIVSMKQVQGVHVPAPRATPGAAMPLC